MPRFPTWLGWAYKCPAITTGRSLQIHATSLDCANMWMMDDQEFSGPDNQLGKFKHWQMKKNQENRAFNAVFLASFV